MAAKPGMRHNSWTLCNGMRGDVGSLIGLHRGNRGGSPCWLGPEMRTAMSNLISMTRITGATSSIIRFQSRYLLTVRRMVRGEEPRMNGDRLWEPKRRISAGHSTQKETLG